MTAIGASPVVSRGADPQHMAAMLESFARHYPYGEFRRYASVNGESRRTCLRGVLQNLMATCSRHSTVEGHGGLLGIATVRTLPWESDHFHLPMAAVSVHVGPSQRRATAERLLDGILADPGPYRLWSLRLDADDFEVRIAAEDRGFRLMDSSCTYEFHPRLRGFPDSLERQYHVRWYQPGDRDAIVDVASESFRSYPSRFSLDPLIGPDAALAMYTTWADKCCTGEMATHLMVAERRGRVVGFLGWRDNRDLIEHAGVRVQGSGLCGFRPIRYGAYRELVWSAIETCGRPPSDYETHLSNLAANRVYQSLGLPLVRVRHTFHWWG